MKIGIIVDKSESSLGNAYFKNHRLNLNIINTPFSYLQPFRSYHLGKPAEEPNKFII